MLCCGSIENQDEYPPDSVIDGEGTAQKDRATLMQLPAELIACFYEDGDGSLKAFNGVESTQINSIIQERKRQPNAQLPETHLLRGLYKLCLSSKVNGEGAYAIRPIYWDGDEHAVIRGNWFTAVNKMMLPIGDADGDVAQKVEGHHLGLIRASSRSNESLFPSTLAIRQGLKFTWQSLKKVTMFDDDKRTALQKMTQQNPTPVRVIRGFVGCQAQTTPVEKMILLLHGTLENMSNGVEENARNLNEQLEKSSKYHYPRQLGHCVVLPVNWRKGLDLGKHDELLQRVEIEQPDSGKTFFTQYVIRPAYVVSHVGTGAEINNHVINVLKAVYEEYKEKNNFCGTVSIIDHSLGAVIAAKVLTDDFKSSECPGLPFKVDSLYLFGSPLALFLINEHLDKVRDALNTVMRHRRLFNVYFSDDVVAFRLNPLMSDVPKAEIVITGCGHSGSVENVGGSQRDMPRVMVGGETSSSAVGVDVKIDGKGELVAAHSRYWKDPDVAVFLLRTLFGEK